jgi:hypothetical protein
MLGTGFAREIIAPAGDGQPDLVAVPLHWAARVVAAHPVAWDVPFAATQLLIGLGLLVPRTARLALAASVAWSIGVWYFGEGLGGLAGGHASLLTGAPGAALLYGVLALAAWPGSKRDRAAEAPAGWLPVAWAVLWIGEAVFQALPGQNTGAAIAGALTNGAAGAPGPLQRLDGSLGGWIMQHGAPVVVTLVVAEALIGLAALHRRRRPLAAATGFVLALAIWVIGEDLGMLFTGRATDPNTDPLIALMAVAVMRRSRPRDLSRRAKLPERTKFDGAGRLQPPCGAEEQRHGVGDPKAAEREADHGRYRLARRSRVTVIPPRV